MTRVLIVEDEEHLAAGLKFNLDAEGYDVEVEDNGRAALDRLSVADADAFDLVLLDIMLPGLDGFEVIRRLRDAGNFVPVMILTARGQTDDVLQGFEVGADDYLPKPFDLTVLLARIQGLLRRKERLGRRVNGGGADEPNEYRFAGGRIDFSRQLVERNGREQVLTLMETALLSHLVRHEGTTVTRQRAARRGVGRATGHGHAHGRQFHRAFAAAPRGRAVETAAPADRARRRLPVRRRPATLKRHHGLGNPKLEQRRFVRPRRSQRLTERLERR